MRTSLCQVIPRSQDQSKKMLSELKSHHVRYTVPFDEVWMMAPRTAQQTSAGNLNGAQCAPPSSDPLTIISFPSSHPAQIPPTRSTPLPSLSLSPPPPAP